MPTTLSKTSVNGSARRSRPSRGSSLAPLLAAAIIYSCVYVPEVMNSQPVQSYSGSIEPIFQEKCSACHNHSIRQGGLSLESYESLMNGGRRGAVIIAGESEESRLFKMIEGSIQPRMPIGDALTAEEIKIIKAWIDAGAPGPVDRRAKPGAGLPDPASPLKPAIPEIKPVL